MTRAGLLLATICAVAASARADTFLRWTELSRALKGTTIDVTTKSGEIHHGKFLEAQPDLIVLKENGRAQISRAAIATLHRERRVRGSHLAGFGECLGYIAVIEVGGLASLELPLMLIAIPVTAAVGIVGVPVLAIWELFDRQIQKDSIMILPDPAPGVSQ